ncbi:DUF2188 domain-containing protein [Microlunatus parietis]|uniref:DUF2188 domain-containing protein n=1 Tax=Microlunatus parietis TaxID=682979 RepID=A0A7Y9I389_9ACTN|nr:DUF2188 domain-containing protein [Microlunatus parietis]NYE69440.1 hypothetical protein [Microlunatus parietis]
MTRTEFHVVPDRGAWVIEHAGRSLGRHDSLAAAVVAANDRARRVQPSRVMVHDEDGRVFDQARPDAPIPART